MAVSLPSTRAGSSRRRRHGSAWLAAAISAVLVSSNAVAGVRPPNQPAERGDYLVQSNWSLSYSVSNDDAVVVTSAQYKGSTVFAKAAIPYIKVTYTDPADYNGSLFDQLGTGNGTYRNDLQKINVTNGFELRASFVFGSWPNDGSYKYVQHYFFWTDGSFQVAVDVYGPGFGPSAHYTTMWRIDFDIRGASSDELRQWTSAWTLRPTEGKFIDDGTHAPAGSEWANNNEVSGQDATYFTKPYSPDSAYLYGVRWRSGEEGGGTNGTVWPSTYVNGESINVADIVDWYEAHSYPCSSSNICYPGPHPYVQNGY